MGSLASVMITRKCPPFLKNQFLLEYSYITLLCQFLLCSQLNHLCVCISPLFGFPSNLGHHGALRRVPVRYCTFSCFLSYTQCLLLLLSRFSRVRLCATPQMAAHQAPPSLGFSRQEHWSGLPFPSPMQESEK